MTGIEFRRYDDRDSGSIVALDEWALQNTGTDPEDIPGREDLHDIEGSYLDAGGDFVVGILANEDSDFAVERDWLARIETRDGLVVAMGGFLPNEAGHEDERTVAGAAELHRMRIAPPCQRRGYGTALLEELESRATEADIDHLLATTAFQQESAVAFYPSFGYERVGTSTFEEYELVHFEKHLE